MSVTWGLSAGSQHSIPWWHLSAVTDSSEDFLGVDFRLQLFDHAGLLVSAETARALRTYASQISVP